jgi:methenyltetrahydrofolate cyclohydrolase
MSVDHSTIAEQSLRRFLDELASAAPTPGGGGAAAVMGAMAAALVSMVCHITLGKKEYEGVEAQIRKALEQADGLRQRLTEMIAADAQAFDALMAAYKLPRSTDAEKQVRGEAIQQALKRATEVPLDCAQACAEVIELSQRVAPIGNRSVISDAGVAALAAYAALRSAALAVYINAPSIKDSDFVQPRRARLDALLARCGADHEWAYETVIGRLG